MELTDTFHAQDRAEWRKWLTEHHTTDTEVWLIYFKAETGKPAVQYEDSVEEALCFGWVDSLIQKIDEERYARKFTPRKPGSSWSFSNKRRVAMLIADGRMTPAGLAKIDYPLDEPLAKPEKKELDIPSWLALGLQTSQKAWQNFNSLPPSHQRRYVLWISDAKRDETRQKRILEAIELLEQNKRLGIGEGEVRK
jgi:uncharacterized protein YdeI (YjbR/CyaY-like superfamily)